MRNRKQSRTSSTEIPAIGLSTKKARRILVEDVLSTLKQDKVNGIFNTTSSSSSTTTFSSFPHVSKILWTLFIVSLILCNSLSECIIMFIVAFTYTSLTFIEARLHTTEKRKRILSVLNSIQLEDDSNNHHSQNHKHNRVILEPSPSYIATYRDDCWQRIPINMLVTSDVIGLMTGDVAPGSVSRLYKCSSSKGVLSRGEVVLHDPDSPRRTVRSSSSASSSSHDSTTFLKMCGDMKLYRMTETPVVSDIVLSVQNTTTRTTLFQKRLNAGYYVIQVLGVCITCIYITLLYLLNSQSENLITTIVLCFTPLSYPLVFLISEAYGTARLLSIIDNTKNESDNDSDEIEDREAKRLERVFHTKNIFKNFYKVLKSRLLDSSSDDNIIPFASCRTLENLGAVTMLACVDDDSVCDSSPCVDEIFLMKEDSINSTVVLDVHKNKSSCNSISFEDPKWKSHVSSLKPIGLNILMNNYPSVPSNTTSSSTDDILNSLASHIRQLPSPSHLLSLSREIGFKDCAQAIFETRHMIHVIDPTLAREEHMADTHAAGLEDTKLRGNLKSHVVSNVVYDNRSSGLHIMSRGNPSLILNSCNEYWNGSSICPLSQTDRDSILDMYKTWKVEDMDVVGFSYGPLPVIYNSAFNESSSNTSYLVTSFEKVPKSSVDDYSVTITSPKKLVRSYSGELKASNADTSSITSKLWQVQRNQIFLGMVASGIQPKEGVSEFIEDCNNVGIRFVYFSPRNMKRSKHLVEKMGIETDWNCAISLRTLLPFEEHDPHRMTSSYADWDVKAKLPHGIKAIRKHLEEVDNVPLLVSLFTDSTPVNVEAMVKIFQEYHEVVLVVGASMDERNSAIFNTADIAISLQGSLASLSSRTTPLMSKDFVNVLNASDIQISRVLNTIPCALSVDAKDGDENAIHSPKLNTLLDMISLGRVLLVSSYNQLWFCATCQVFIAAVVMIDGVSSSSKILSQEEILFLLCIVIPALAIIVLVVKTSNYSVLRESNIILTRTPEKNEAIDKRHWSGSKNVFSSRYSFYVMARVLPSAIITNVVHRCYFMSNSSNYYALLSTLMYSVLMSRSSTKSIIIIIIPLIVLLLLLPEGYYEMSVILIVQALVYLLIDHSVICMHDEKASSRYYKFLRMQFDTRLGQWSPR